MFDGFRSPWATPRRWAWSSASASRATIQARALGYDSPAMISRAGRASSAGGILGGRDPVEVGQQVAPRPGRPARARRRASRTAARVAPPRNGMQTRCKAPSSAAAWRRTSTMWGCRARARSLGSAVGRVETLSTTRRWSRSACSARKTRANAPRPSSRTRRYGPISSPAEGRSGRLGPVAGASRPAGRRGARRAGPAARRGRGSGGGTRPGRGRGPTPRPGNTRGRSARPSPRPGAAPR